MDSTHRGARIMPSTQYDARVKTMLQNQKRKHTADILTAALLAQYKLDDIAQRAVVQRAAEQRAASKRATNRAAKVHVHKSYKLHCAKGWQFCKDITEVPFGTVAVWDATHKAYYVGPPPTYQPPDDVFPDMF